MGARPRVQADARDAAVLAAEVSGEVRTVGASLVCTQCGTPSIIRRLAARRKKAGHVKHMWCPMCEDVVRHEEERVEDA